LDVEQNESGEGKCHVKHKNWYLEQIFKLDIFSPGQTQLPGQCKFDIENYV
jgi:hypothetical protein